MKRSAMDVAERIVSTVFNNLDNNCDWTTSRSTVEYMVAVMILDYQEERDGGEEWVRQNKKKQMLRRTPDSSASSA